MPLFLNNSERAAIESAHQQDPLSSIYWALINRVELRAASPGLSKQKTTTDWWHHTAEYLSDAAIVNAIHYRPSQVSQIWLHDTALSIARRPIEDWVGPAFRSHVGNEPAGNLETAHLSWGLAVVLDLAADLFTASEQEEIQEALSLKGILLCRRMLEQRDHLANWQAVLNAGVAVAAAVLNDLEALDFAKRQYQLCQQMFQPDGSHSESLQYGNYAAMAQMLSWEALTRHTQSLQDELSLEPYVRMPRWQAANFLYQKPASGWGSKCQGYSANFNDSAALFRPSGDLLLHIASRAKHSHPKEAGLARWLFDTHYLPYTKKGPDDLASFGFYNDIGFLTPVLLGQAIDALTPEDAGMGTSLGFSCGDMIARDKWNGLTILAARGASNDALYGPGHLHGDLNSCILVHNEETLLADPGHSCYRNNTRQLDIATGSHNTCTFEHEGQLLQQRTRLTRKLNPETLNLDDPIHRGGKRLILERCNELTVLGSECTELYGDPIQEFSRFWFLCGSHAVFIVDRISANTPVRTKWNWLMDNRDDALELKLVHPDRLVARRGNAGMKLFHLGNANIEGPVHAHIHDAYHPLPAQLGEGASGTGKIVRWAEPQALTDRIIIHAISMDSYGQIANWHLQRDHDGFDAILKGPNDADSWKLRVDNSGQAIIVESVGNQYRVTQQSDDQWRLSSQ